jgi:PKD repeat protein
VTRASISRARVAGVAAIACALAACTIKETPTPGFMGPSEYAISVTLAAVPDLVMRDGVSQSTIVVRARDPQGGPIRSLQLRLDMVVNNMLQDFGTLSTRTLFTNAEGEATAIYTAPPPPSTGASLVTNSVTFLVSPVGSNAQAAQYTTAEIRLVIPVTSTPGAPVAFFTFAPAAGITPATNVQFNAGGSYPVTGSRIVNYAWDWGDGTTDNINSGPSEDHDWAGAGSYSVTLTVTDDLGQRASTTQIITVG